MSLISLLAATAVGIQTPQVTDDARAKEGMAVFFEMCGSTVAGVERPAAPTGFTFTELSPETAAEIRPMWKGQTVWDVQGYQSELSALLYVDAHGVCALEIAEAREDATRTYFAEGLRALAETLGGRVEHKQDTVKQLEGKPMTSSEWRISGRNGNFVVGLTTYPDGRFMTQHKAMLAQVR